MHSCALSFTVFILKCVEGGNPSFRLKAPENVDRGRRAAPRPRVIGSENPLQLVTPP